MNNFYPIVGVGAVVIHKNRVLLVKRKNNPGKGFWAIPGGKLKFGENLKTAVEREIYEETGVKIKALEPVHVFDMISNNKTDGDQLHYVIIDYNAEYLSGIIKAADDAEEAGWISAEEAEQLNLHSETYELLIKKIGFLKKP